MASLNTLRTRGGVIVTIVIGIALLAFLIGDFAPRGCNEHNVGIIEGDKIDYFEYGERADRYTHIVQRMSGGEALSAEQTDQARNMAWESLIAERSHQPGFRKLGLWTSEAEQIDMITGVYISPVIAASFPTGEAGQVDYEGLRMFSTSPDPSDMLVWGYLKESMVMERVISKFVNLVGHGMFVTDLEVQEAVTSANKTSDARVARFAYNDIPDSLVRLTKGEIKAYYDAHRKKYKQEASREIEYVVFDLLPSQQDYADAEKYINEIAIEFEESETPFQYATLNSQTRPDNRFLSEAQVDAQIAAAVWGKPEAVYGPVLSGDIYTIAREGEVRMMPDTLGARHILLSFDQAQLADSLAEAVRNGADFGELALEYSRDEFANRSGGDLGRFAPEQMVPAFSEAVLEAQSNEVVVVPTQFGLHVVQKTYASAPVRKAQIATIRYRVEPSNHTQQSVYAEATGFMAEASGSYENFRRAAAEAALSKRVARIRTTDRVVSGLDDSRELVRWAFNSKQGQVSDVMEMGGDYVIAAVTGVRNDGYATLEEATDEIRPIVRREKKADMIIAGLNGTTLAQAEPDPDKITEVEGVTFASFYLNGIGVEQKVIGAIIATDRVNQLSAPVRGDQGVYLFEVTDINTSDTATAESERVKLEATATSYSGQRALQALSETVEITDNRVRYF